MTSTALTTYAQSSLSERQEYARLLATAGDMIPRALREANGTPNLGKVLLVMETGAMLGIHPVAALQGVNVIEGKATLSAALMSALIRRAGHKLSVEVTGTIEGGDLTATVTLKRCGSFGVETGEVFTSVWTPKRAHQAGLCAYTEKDGAWSVKARSQSGKALPWEAYTAQLCKARAISEVYIEGATDLAMGAIYTPEEMGDTDEYEQSEGVGTAAASAIAAPAREADDKWIDDIADAETLDALREVWERARTAGVLADTLGEGTVRSYLEERARDLGGSPGESKTAITDEQTATIDEWASTLDWNERRMMAHVKKVVGEHVENVAALTEAEAGRVIVSLSALEPQAETEGMEPML